MRYPSHAVAGYWPPLSVRADPELGMHLVLGNYLAREDMAHEEVVVHSLRYDLRDRRRVELEERIMLRLASLQRPVLSTHDIHSTGVVRTFLLRDSRSRVTVPNCEKYARIWSS